MQNYRKILTLLLDQSLALFGVQTSSTCSNVCGTVQADILDPPLDPPRIPCLDKPRIPSRPDGVPCTSA